MPFTLELLNLFGIVFGIVFGLVAMVVIFAEKFEGGECRLGNFQLVEIEFDLI